MLTLEILKMKRLYLRVRFTQSVAKFNHPFCLQLIRLQILKMKRLYLRVRFTQSVAKFNHPFCLQLIRLLVVSMALCNSNPCMNGGTCQVAGQYSDTLQYIPFVECHCRPGYLGDNCEGEFTTLSS